MTSGILLGARDGAGGPRPVAAGGLLALCCAAQFLVVLDVTVVNVALPDLQRVFALSDTGRQWIINAYAVAFAGFLMLGARLGDRYGRRRMFIAGTALFTAFDVLGGFAPDGAWLIAARAGEGLGGAVLAPATLSLLTSTFTGARERRRAVGLWSVFAASGASAGLVGGGVLTELLDWRWIFFLKAPVGLALLAGARRWMPADPRSTRAGRLDVPGAVTVTAALALLAYGVAQAGQRSWTAPATLGLIGAGVVALVVFVLIERRKPDHALVPLDTFRNRTFSVANGVAAVVGAALFGMYYFVPRLLEEVNGYSAMRSGFAFVPAGLATVAGALAGTRLVDRLGHRRQITAGLILACAGMAWLSTAHAGAAYAPHVLGPLLLTGCGLGLSFVPTTQAATQDATPERAGLASGLVTTTRQFGAAIGLAVMAAVAGTAADGAAPAAGVLAAQCGRAFAVNAGILALGVCAAQLLHPRSRPVARTKQERSLNA